MPGLGRAGVPVWTYCRLLGNLVTVFDIPSRTRNWSSAPRPPSRPIRSSAFPRRRLRPGPIWPGRTCDAQTSADRLLEFLSPTPMTTVTPAVAAAVTDATRGAEPVEAAEEIAAHVRSRVRYMTGATGVLTDAQEAWDQGQGVCQDMAHVTVALLRAAGLPARYVSGYLHADPEAEPGQSIAGQSHAWAEYWAGSWLACDPTSGAPVAERHVVVARGRDYADVPPHKGIYHGAPGSTLGVTVEVTRLA